VGAVEFRAAPSEERETRGRAPRRRRIPDERAEEIRQAALQILPGSYFKALGVDIAAHPDEIEAAYQEAVARFHPDAFAGQDLGGLEELLAQSSTR
jgi:DnaJ-domain-containing protein 1